MDKYDDMSESDYYFIITPILVECNMISFTSIGRVCDCMYVMVACSNCLFGFVTTQKRVE